MLQVFQVRCNNNNEYRWRPRLINPASGLESSSWTLCGIRKVESSRHKILPPILR